MPPLRVQFSTCQASGAIKRWYFLCCAFFFFFFFFRCRCFYYYYLLRHINSLVWCAICPHFCEYNSLKSMPGIFKMLLLCEGAAVNKIKHRKNVRTPNRTKWKWIYTVHYYYNITRHARMESTTNCQLTRAASGKRKWKYENKGEEKTIAMKCPYYSCGGGTHNETRNDSAIHSHTNQR